MLSWLVAMSLCLGRKVVHWLYTGITRVPHDGERLTKLSAATVMWVCKHDTHLSLVCQCNIHVRIFTVNESLARRTMSTYPVHG